MTEQQTQQTHRTPPALLAVGYAVFLLAGALTAIVEVLLVPTRWGTALVPIAPVLAVLSNVALPAISRGLTDSMVSAVPPVIGWIVTAFMCASAPPGSDVLLPAGSTTAVSYALLLGGAGAGLITVGFAGRSGPWTGQWLRGRRARPGSDSGGAR